MVEKMINHGTVQLETHCGDHLTALLYKKKSNDLVDHCYLFTSFSQSQNNILLSKFEQLPQVQSPNLHQNALQSARLKMSQSESSMTESNH